MLNQRPYILSGFLANEKRGIQSSNNICSMSRFIMNKLIKEIQDPAEKLDIDFIILYKRPGFRAGVRSCSILNLRPSRYCCKRFLFQICGAGVEPSSLLLRQFIDLLYQPWMIDSDDCGSVRGMNEWHLKSKHWEKTRPSAALFTTDPTLFETAPPRWESEAYRKRY
jgi:hypothetical protein